MIIYIFLMGYILTLSTILTSNRYRKTRKNFFLISSFLLMVLIIGLRSIDVGEDTKHFLRVFYNAQNISWKQLLYHPFRIAYYSDGLGFTDTIESGFIILCKLIGLFSGNGRFFLLTVAAITFILIGKFIIDNSKDYFWPVYIVLSDFLFMYAFNGIRQILAVSIALQAFTLLKKNKIGKTVWVLLLASYIHNTAIVCFILLPIMFIKPKKEYRMFRYAFVIAIVFPLFLSHMRNIIVMVFPRYEGYFLQNYWVNSIGGSYIVYTFELMLIYMMYRMHFRNSEMSFQLSVLVLLFISLEIGGLQISAFGRLSQYFRAYVVLFMPEAFSFFTPRTRRYIKAIVFILLLLLYLSYIRVESRQYI